MNQLNKIAMITTYAKYRTWIVLQAKTYALNTLVKTSGQLIAYFEEKATTYNNRCKAPVKWFNIKWLYKKLTKKLINIVFIIGNTNQRSHSDPAIAIFQTYAGRIGKVLQVVIYIYSTAVEYSWIRILVQIDESHMGRVDIYAREIRKKKTNKTLTGIDNVITIIRIT